MGLYERNQERAVLGNASTISQGLSSAQLRATSASSRAAFCHSIQQSHIVYKEQFC